MSNWDDDDDQSNDISSDLNRYLEDEDDSDNLDILMGGLQHSDGVAPDDSDDEDAVVISEDVKTTDPDDDE